MNIAKLLARFWSPSLSLIDRRDLLQRLVAEGITDAMSIGAVAALARGEITEGSVARYARSEAQAIVRDYFQERYHRALSDAQVDRVLAALWSS